jgi:PII-like signaling protein
LFIVPFGHHGNQEKSAMKLPSEAELLRIFIGATDKLQGRPLYEAIVDEARVRGLAGATVLKGNLGFGASSRLNAAKALELSDDLPVVIEIVDMPERIADFLPELDDMIRDGLVTLERVRVITYRHDVLQREN